MFYLIQPEISTAKWLFQMFYLCIFNPPASSETPRVLKWSGETANFKQK